MLAGVAAGYLPWFAFQDRTIYEDAVFARTLVSLKLMDERDYKTYLTEDWKIRDAIMERLESAAISRIDRWDEATRRRWRAEGSLEVVNARTGQRIPVGTALLDEAESGDQRLDIMSAARRIDVPWLIVHGTSDESVPIAEGERLARAGGPELTTWLPVEGAGHTFGAAHPWKPPVPAADLVFDATCSFSRARCCVPPEAVGLPLDAVRTSRESPAMPIYDYQCNACGSRFERLVRGAATVACACGSGKVERLMSLTARPAPSSGGQQAPAAAPATGGCCGGSCRSHAH